MTPGHPKRFPTLIPGDSQGFPYIETPPKQRGFPRVSLCGVFPQGAPGAEHRIPLTLNHAPYFLLARPMPHRLRRAPPLIVTAAGDANAAAPVAYETFSATRGIVALRENP